MTNRAALLAANPNGVFGILLALELGKQLDAMAERAGITVDALSVIVRQARDGELRRVGSSKGDAAAVTVPSPRPASIPDRKPEPLALPAPAREEKPKMTEVMPVGLGARPDLAWVDVTLIDVDKTYQRDADRKSVQKILGDFRWDHFGAVVLARKADGRFNCTDGQHRVIAAREHPDVTEVPALITALDGTAAEADNFLTINRARRAVSTIDIYWAGLAAGDETTLRVRDVMAAADCQACRAAGDHKPGHTMAVSSVNRAIERYGDAAAIAGLKTIRATWPNDSKALRGTLIVALARIHRASERVDDERMSRVLRAKTYAELTAHAEAFRKLSGGAPDTVIARTIAELYNKGLSTNFIYFGEAA